MKIAFLVERNVYFRVFGAMIDMALKRGHQVFCLHNYGQPKTGSKGYQFPFIEQTPKFFNGNTVSLSYQSQIELKEIILDNEIKVVFSLEFPTIILDIKNELKEKAVYWVSLQNGFDIAFSGNNMDKPDRFFIYTLTWINWLFAYFKKTGKASQEKIEEFKKIIGTKVKPVGFWPKDQSNIIDKNEVKKKWSIPQDKKVVLLAPFPFSSSLKTFWTKYIYGTRFFGKQNDFQICSAIRQFCDKNNAFLLVKSRKKDPVRKYLAKVADKVVYDERFYPATMMECLAVADICLSFYSTVAMEAACSRVPHICVAPAVDDWKDLQSPYFETIFEEMGDFFDFPGVSWKISIPEAIKKLKQASFSDFTLNESQLEKYQQKFIGGLSGSYSSDIIKEIEYFICPTNHCP